MYTHMHISYISLYMRAQYINTHACMSAYPETIEIQQVCVYKYIIYMYIYTCIHVVIAMASLASTSSTLQGSGRSTDESQQQPGSAMAIMGSPPLALRSSVNTHICMYIYMYIHTCIYIYTYANMHTHKYANMGEGRPKHLPI